MNNFDNTSMVSNIREEKYNHLRDLPDNQSLYKCPHCKYIFNINNAGMANILAILSGKWFSFCPICKRNDSELLCKVDSYSLFLKRQGIKCRNGESIAGVELCPICNHSICPQCMNHNVIAVSRVTGYMGVVDGWNNGKKQELLDRQHYNI